MIENLTPNKENTDDGVRQNSFDEQIKTMFDSLNSFSVDFFDVYDSLSKDDQQSLIIELNEWISTGKVNRYFDRKYIRRREDIDLKFADSFEFKIAQKTDHYSLALDFYPADWESQFPATDDWITLKKEHSNKIIAELGSLIDSKNNSEKLNNIDNLDPSYLFPIHLIDRDYNSISIIDFRISVKGPLRKLTKNLQYNEPLLVLKDALGNEEFKAFLYNSFDFDNNPTAPKALNLSLPNKGIEKFYQKLYDLYKPFKTWGNDTIEDFTKILFLNFHKFRVDKLEDKKNRIRHFHNLKGKIRDYGYNKADK